MGNKSDRENSPYDLGNGEVVDDDGGPAEHPTFRFALADDTPKQPPPTTVWYRRSSVGWLSLGAVCAALLGVATQRGVSVRTSLPLLLSLIAVTAIIKRYFMRRPTPDAERPETTSPHPELVLRRNILWLQTGPSPDARLRPLLPLGSGFGCTLVSNHQRDRLIAAVTARDGTLYVDTKVDSEDRLILSAMLQRSLAIAHEDAGYDAIGPDGLALRLTPSAFPEFINALRALEPGCLERVVLSDVTGAPVTLDGHELRIRDLWFDLAAPLEWQPILFQESYGNSVAVYQGTWIRQSGSEVVLVSLLPSLGFGGEVEPYTFTGDDDLDRAAIRDRRLLHASPEDPPPRERRVAIDRAFMLPLRAALDAAPRASNQPLRAEA